VASKKKSGQTIPNVEGNLQIAFNFFFSLVDKANMS